MKVCGFTFIRNARKFDFPVLEAITSVLPLCDLFVVAVGKSEDNTREIIENIRSDKISIIDTVWDETLKKDGAVYAVETNKAFDAVPTGYDWCFYIQGDEVLHEKYLPVVERALNDSIGCTEVEGLLFGFKHFYGTYDYVGDSRKWYRNEIRVIRNDKTIRSYRDAQGFRKQGRKLKVAPVEAEIYHYGWVRHPQFMQQKVDAVRKYYDGISKEKYQGISVEKDYNYSRHYDALAPFKGSHPSVMQERAKRLNWEMDADLDRIRMPLRYRLLYFIEKWVGIRLFEYRNYNMLKKNSK